MDAWISLFKITSILAAGFFGALGLLTKYKDDAGKITRWGRVALGGILLSSSFSVLLYALEASKAKAAAEKAKAEANATAQLLQNILVNAQTTAEQQQRSLNETNQLKLGLEEALKQQQLNLQRSDYIAKGMENSLSTQQSVLSGNERILGGVTSTIEKQGEILSQTTTTLHDTQRLLQPIGEIKVGFAIGISESPNTSGYLKYLREEFKRAKQLSLETGKTNVGQGIRFGSFNSIWIGPDSPLLPNAGSKAGFLKIIPFYINFYRAKVTPSMWLDRRFDMPKPDLKLHVLGADFDQGPGAQKVGFDRGENLRIEYDMSTDSFSLHGSFIKAGTWYDNGSITSTLDLPGLTMVVEFLNRHEELSLLSLEIEVAKAKRIYIKQGTLKKLVIHGRECYFHSIRPENIIFGF